MIVSCEYCSKDYNTPLCWYKRNKHHCCSRECSDKLKIKLNTKTCLGCSKEFHRKNHNKEAKYCSSECSSKAKTKQVLLTCGICEKEYSVNLKRKETSKFCSKGCSSKYLGYLSSLKVGELSGNYKGYKDEKRKIKSRLKTWANEVKRRDKCCQMCKDTACLSAHHIKPFSSHPDLRFELTNGILLCGKCHAEQHKNDKVKVTQLILNKYVQSNI